MKGQRAAAHPRVRTRVSARFLMRSQMLTLAEFAREGERRGGVEPGLSHVLLFQIVTLAKVQDLRGTARPGLGQPGCLAPPLSSCVTLGKSVHLWAVMFLSIKVRTEGNVNSKAHEDCVG